MFTVALSRDICTSLSQQERLEKLMEASMKVSVVIMSSLTTLKPGLILLKVTHGMFPKHFVFQHREDIKGLS